MQQTPTHQYTLTYWAIRGTTQSLRYLLQYLQLDYQDNAIQWPKDRVFSIREMLQYPKMPNLNHKGFQVTEIVPIGKYICRSAGKIQLLGKTLRDSVLIDSFISKTFDARNIFLEALMPLQNASENMFQKEMYQRTVTLKQTFLKDLSKVLSVKEWYMGYLTIADFFLFNVLLYIQGYVPSIITGTSIEEYMKRFEGLEELRMYFKNGKGNHPMSFVEAINNKWKGRKLEGERV